MTGTIISNTAALGRVILNSDALNTSDSISIGIRLLIDGTARTLRTGSGDLVYSWFLLPISNIGSKYEARTVVSIGSFTSGPPSGSWVAIDGAISLWQRNIAGSVQGLLEIRIASVDVTVVSMAFLLTRT